jgi:hypothetical protein
VIQAGASVPRLRQIWRDREPSENLLIAVLRRSVPAAFLEVIASMEAWEERPRVLAAVVQNPRTRPSLALRLLTTLYWRDLASVASSLWLAATVRLRAEELLKEQLPDLRLGDRVALARLATRAVLVLLVQDCEPKVVDAALQNPRLRQADLATAVEKDGVSVSLLNAVASSRRWREHYALRLALVLQPRTPLALGIAQLSSLQPADLRHVLTKKDLAPLVRLIAQRLLAEPARPGAPPRGI